MDSQYAILTLKYAGCNLNNDDLINKDLCVDCFDKISKFMEDSKAMVVSLKDSSNWVTIKDSMKQIDNHLFNKQSGAWKTEPLNKHLDVTCV